MHQLYLGIVVIISLITSSSCISNSTGNTTCRVLGHINGCSTPFRVPFYYKDQFTPACNSHDACYECGKKYGWTQVDCDISFKNHMKLTCIKKPTTTTTSQQQKQSLTYGLTDDLTKSEIYTIFRVLYDGWIEATKNSTSTEEMKRLWNQSMEIFNSILEWRHINDPVEHCNHGADIYMKIVKTFGVYAYRQKSQSFCDENCAKILGDPGIISN